MSKEYCRVNGKLTSEYILEFEDKKGTPNNETEDEYLEIINIARGHLQCYEQALQEPTLEELKEQIEKLFRTEYRNRNLNKEYYLTTIEFTKYNIIVNYRTAERKPSLEDREIQKCIWVNETINGLFNISLELAGLITTYFNLHSQI